jgi:lipopolysaccharide/colanic/teichoic acid biosynthesis glycosyltransferase
MRQKIYLNSRTTGLGFSSNRSLSSGSVSAPKAPIPPTETKLPFKKPESSSEAGVSKWVRDYKASSSEEVSPSPPYSPPFTFKERGRIYSGVKRFIDILFAIMGLFLFILALPFIAFLIKVDSPGPVFFTQERVGIDRRRRQNSGYPGSNRRKVIRPGKPFMIYKLRTMRVNAEANGPRWAARHDNRVTRIGRLLRKSRLDEVPQFLNVLRGDMSLIGPRPERLCFIRNLEKEIPNYCDRLLVLPGITGLAQVRNGYDKDTRSVEKKVALDCTYIQKRNFWLDLRIILSTFRVVITGEGAH